VWRSLCLPKSIQLFLRSTCWIVCYALHSENCRGGIVDRPPGRGLADANGNRLACSAHPPPVVSDPLRTTIRRLRRKRRTALRRRRRRLIRFYRIDSRAFAVVASDRSQRPFQRLAMRQTSSRHTSSHRQTPRSARYGAVVVTLSSSLAARGRRRGLKTIS